MASFWGGICAVGFAGREGWALVAHTDVMGIGNILMSRAVTSHALPTCMPHVVFQYNYLGSDLNAVTQKMIQVFSFVNNVSLAEVQPLGLIQRFNCSETKVCAATASAATFQIFNPLNVTVVLSSMELWMQQNRIPTDGAADELLQQFLQWKRSHLALQPYDVTYLFV